MIKPLLPYPGNRWRSRSIILARLAQYDGWQQFREPFVGSGAISIAMITDHPQRTIWLNDLDRGVCCLWRALRDHPDLLRERVHAFVPSRRAYEQLQACLQSGPIAACDHDIVHLGFCKLAIHCLSFSGIGVAAGPLGGERAEGRIGRKWSPQYLCDKITRLQHHITHVRITATDYKPLLLDGQIPALIYLDPPFFAAGRKLYQHFFATYEDHVELARRLRCTPHPWVMSYDDCPQIRCLYSDWAGVEYLPVKYTLTGLIVEKAELLISSRPVLAAK